jgi:hypothetical protein
MGKLVHGKAGGQSDPAGTRALHGVSPEDRELWKVLPTYASIRRFPSESVGEMPLDPRSINVARAWVQGIIAFEITSKVSVPERFVFYFGRVSSTSFNVVRAPSVELIRWLVATHIRGGILVGNLFGPYLSACRRKNSLLRKMTEIVCNRNGYLAMASRVMRRNLKSRLYATATRRADQA